MIKSKKMLRRALVKRQPSLQMSFKLAPPQRKSIYITQHTSSLSKNLKPPHQLLHHRSLQFPFPLPSPPLAPKSHKIQTIIPQSGKLIPASSTSLQIHPHFRIKPPLHVPTMIQCHPNTLNGKGRVVDLLSYREPVRERIQEVWYS